MEMIIVLVAIGVLGLGAMVAAGAFGGMQSEPVRDSQGLVLPDTGIGGDDVRQLRFSVSPRGYNMAEVDAVLHRVADELDGTGRRAKASGRPENSGSTALAEAPEVPVSKSARSTAATDDADPVRQRANQWRGKSPDDESNQPEQASGSRKQGSPNTSSEDDNLWAEHSGS